jgi:hypothetical protein
MIRGMRHTKVLLRTRLLSHGPAHSEVGSSSLVELSNVHGGGVAGIVTAAVTTITVQACTILEPPIRGLIAGTLTREAARMP